ncbi:hornerin-like [Pimephales promelas]|uniref:hornerin-like n=1 Tax=Pimephales promelas TaxID=90988 RepID=UPI00195586F5|nr:hornerin-like [Pimephales promelas]
MLGLWSTQGFLFAMDKGWTQFTFRLPLFVIFLLFLRTTHGFKGGARSDAHHWWGQPSYKTFSPRAVQSSVSEVPVTGILPEEVGSSRFTNRPLKRLNLHQFVKGGVSSSHGSMSHAQTAPSSSVLASLPLPLNERYIGHLTSLQGSSGSAATDTTSVSTQGESSFPAMLGTSGLSTSDQRSPSLYMSSSLETFGAKSAEATLPMFSQESMSSSSSSSPGATYTSQGSPVLASEGSGQSISPQGESSSSGLSQGALSEYNQDSNNMLSSSVSSQSTSDQSTPSLSTSSIQGSSGSLLEASGSSFQGEVAGVSLLVDLSPQSQDHSSQLLPSPLEVSSQSTNGQSTPSLFMLGSESSSDSQSTDPASPQDTEDSLSQSISSQSTSVQSSPSVSTSTQSRSATKLTSSNFFPVQGGSSSTSLYLKPQGALYAPASHTKYVSFPMSSHPAFYSQSKSSSGPWFGGSTGFATEGMSSAYSGSFQPQGTTSQFASGSPSYYPSVSPCSQSAAVHSSQKQFASSYGTQSGSSKLLTLQGSTTNSESLQPQGTTSQFASGSPSYYPSVSPSSPQRASSQSAAVQSSQKQFASTYGTQSGSSKLLTVQGSTTYGESLQPQSTTSQFASGSPSYYPSASLSSPEGASSQSAAVQSSRKQFTSTFTGNSGTQEGPSDPFKWQGSTTYGGSLQPQGTTSQFASGSPSYYPSASLSSPQGASSLSAAVQSSQKQFASTNGTQSGSSKLLTLQGSTTYGESLQPQSTTSRFASGSPSYYPSASFSSPQGASSQSAAVQSSRKQFTSTFTGNSGTQEGPSDPFKWQGSTTYGGSLQPQSTTSRFASGSPSYYPSASFSSPQGASSLSAAVQSSRKQFTSTFTGNSGTQEGPSDPFKWQGSTTYGGSLQPQGTKSQFASGSPSYYPSASLSSPQGASSQSAAVQSSQKQFASTNGTQSGSSKLLTLQGSTTNSESLQPQGTTSQFASGSPSYQPSLSPSPQGASSQSAAVQSSQKPFTSTFTGNSGTQEGPSGPFKWQGSTTYGGSLQPQGTKSQFASGSPSYHPIVSLSSPQGASSQSAAVQSSQKQFASTYGTLSGSSKLLTLQGSTTYGESLQPQSTSQFASGSPSYYPSASLSSPQGASSQSAAVQNSQKQFISTFKGNSGTQEGPSGPFKWQGSTTYGGSLQPQGTISQFASGSPSYYPSASLSSPQGASSLSAAVQSSQKQFTSTFTGNSGTQEGPSGPIKWQGSTTYGGSLQPQGTTSQFASGSLSYYPSASLSSTQGASSLSAAVQSSQKQFASSYGTQSGSSKLLTLPGSTTYGGSLQPQDTTSQFTSGSPSYHPSVSPSSPQGASSQSAAVHSSKKQFTSTFTGNSGTQEGPSGPFKWQGSTTYGGSVQPQGTTNQFASGSPPYYPSASLSSPQGASSQSAAVQSARKQFTSTFTGNSGTQEGPSDPFKWQGSTTYGGSLQPQGTTSQFASGSLSYYPSASLSSPQGASSQSAAVQSSRKQFASSYGTQSGSSNLLTLQGSTTYGVSLQPQGTTSQFASGSPSYYPSASLSSPQSASSLSAAVQSSQKQFTSTFTGNSGIQERPSVPFKWQGSTTYGGSLQPQDSKSQFASGSSSSYPIETPSSPQGSDSQSAAVQSSWKQFVSSYGTHSGSSKPLTPQGSTTYGLSLQPQDTSSQYDSGAPSSYNCHCVPVSSPRGIADQSSQSFQSYSGSQSQKSQRWQPSQGILTSGAAAAQVGSPMQSLFSSPSSAGGFSSEDAGPFVSAQGGSSRYGGLSLHSQRPSSKDTPGSHAYAKLGSSPLTVSSQSTSDERSNGLYNSDSLRTQSLIGVVERPSRLISSSFRLYRQGFLFAMDKGWTQFTFRLPLFVIFLLFLRNTHGFKGGARSDAHHWWGQPSYKTFSPRAVQSSVSEVPVTGILPEEVGSSRFTNRPLKRLNLHQFVKGGVSSSHGSMSHAQTAPSSSVLASLPLPLNERYIGHLTSLQGSSGSAATDTTSVSTQGESSFPAMLGTSGLSTSDQSSPSLYMSSSLETFGAKSAEATLPMFSQESMSSSSSSSPGATYTSQGSPVLASEGSGQSISPQGESSSSGLSQGALSEYNQDSNNMLSSSVSSQSTSDQSTPSLSTSSIQGSSGSLLEASGSSFQGEVAGVSSLVDLSPQSQDNSIQLLPSPLEVSSQSTNGQSTPSLFMLGSESSSDSQSTDPASPQDTEDSLSQSISSQSTSVQSSPSVFTSTQSRSATKLTSSNFFPVQGGSSSTSLYLKPQGTLYAPASHTKYVSFPMSSHPAFYSQSKSSSGPWFGGSTGFATEGMSSAYSGSVQPQGTTSQFASGSPSYYPSVSPCSQSAAVQSSQKQFASSYGTQSGSSKLLTLQGSTTYGESLQPQGTTSQFASSYGTQSGSSKLLTLPGSTTNSESLQPQGTTSPFASGSPSYYPSASPSSPQGASSQSAAVQSSQKQFASTYGTQSGSSKLLTLQGSTTYGESLQPQSTTSRFASGSLSYYPSASLSSPQGASSLSAAVQSSRKQFTSTFTGHSGTQEGPSDPFKWQGSTTYGGSLQPQGTASQFASGSPSYYPSVSPSSPQGAASLSAAVQSSQKQFASSYGTQSGSSKLLTLQGSTTNSESLQPQGTTSQFASGSPSYHPSVSPSSPQGASSQSAAVQSSQKQFTSTFTGNSGTQEGPSGPFKWQGSTTYGGSLQPQGTKSQFASGSPSYHPIVSLSSPQGASSQSAAVQSSQKQFTSTFTGNSGTQEGPSGPIKWQGSTTYGGSLQPQGTTSQFASGSLSYYPSASLSSPQGASSQSAAVQSSQKQFASSYGTQSGSSKLLTLPGSTTYGGSLQPQDTTSQFTSGSPSYHPSVSPSSPQGASSQSAAVQSSKKQFTSTFTGNSGTQEGPSGPFKWQGSTTYGGSLQPQGTTSQFASGSLSYYPSASLSSPQGASSQSAAVQSSRKQFASSYGTQSGSSNLLTLQGSTTYGASLQPQGTTSQFASGSPSYYPSASLSSPQGASSLSAAVQNSQKQFTSTFTGNSGTQERPSVPFKWQGSTTYGGSLQPQDPKSQFASGSSSSYPIETPSSPQGSDRQSAAVQSSWKQFVSSYGTQSGSSKLLTLPGSTTYGGSLQPQDTTSQFTSGSPSYHPSVSPSSPQGASSQSAAVQSSKKQFTSTFTGNSGTQEGPSGPFKWQGSTTYGGSLQPQGTTSQFASGSLSYYPSASLSSPQGVSSQSAAVQSSQKQFASSYGTQSGSSKLLTLPGSTTYGASLQPQGTTSQFASGSPSYYPSASLSSPQGASSLSAAVQSSQKQFTSTFTGNSGTQERPSVPFKWQGSTTYGGSLQPQDPKSQFASGSSSSYPIETPSSPQGSDRQSAAVQSSWKQFVSSYGTQSGSSKPLTPQGSTTYGLSLQPQDTSSQYDSGAPSSYNCHCVPVSSPRGIADQSSQSFQSYSGSQSQKSQRWQPSQGILTSGAAAAQVGSPMQSLFSSASSAGGFSSGDAGLFVSAQGGSSRYGGLSLHSQSPSSKYTPGSHAYAKLGSSPLTVSSQSTSDKRSNGLYNSDSLRTQGLIGVVERPSRLSSQAPSDSTGSNQISDHFVTMQRPTGSNLTPFLGLSAQASAVGMFSGIPQTAQALRESGSGVQLYNKPFFNRLYSVKG